MESFRSETISPAQHLLRDIYHTSIADPSFTFAGLSGRALQLHATLMLQEYDTDDAGWHAEKLCRSFLDECKDEDSYAALSEAIGVAYTIEDYEQLSDFWYLREELSHDETDEIRKLLTDALTSQRYRQPDEFTIALYMSQKGFEDIDETLLLHFIDRLKLCAYQADGVVSESSLLKTLDRKTLYAVHANGGLRLLPYVAAVETRNLLYEESQCSAITLERVDAWLVDFQETLANNAFNGKKTSRSMFFAALAIADLVEKDPGNELYLKWHKKALKYFTRQDRMIFTSISFATSNEADVKLALERLGGVSMHDVLDFMIRTS